MRTLAVILLMVALVLALGIRDDHGLAAYEQNRVETQRTCMADRVAAGAPYWMALNLCGGLDPDEVERNLP